MGFSIEDLNNMIPFERDVYINLLLEQIQKEEERDKG